MDSKLLLAISSLVLMQLVSVSPQESTRGNIHIGKDVTLGQQPAYTGPYYNGYNQPPPQPQPQPQPQTSGVYIQKEVTVGQNPPPSYQTYPPYQQPYQPVGTYGGPYHKQDSSPPPTSTHPQFTACINNGK